jgi:hypothetical protein
MAKFTCKSKKNGIRKIWVVINTTFLNKQDTFEVHRTIFTLDHTRDRVIHCDIT